MLSLPGDSGPGAEVDPWQARIVDDQGRLLGSGVLVSEWYVLTCAHVLSAGQERPTGSFRIGFPRSETGVEVTGRVAADGWFPGAEIDERDVAILQLDHPAAGVRHAGLGRGKRRGRGTPVDVFGHTTSLFNGVSVRVEISHTVGPKNQRVQLSPSRDLSPEAVVRGFSGGGVLDVGTGRVLGIVATAQADAERFVAFMIPMETVGGYWSRLLGWLDGPAARETAVPARTLEQITTLLGLRTAMDRPEGRRWVAGRLPGSARNRLVTPEPTVRQLVQACPLPSELRVLTDLVLYLDEAPAGFGPIEDLLAETGAVRPEPASQPEQVGPHTRRELHRLLMLQGHFVDRVSRATYLAEFRRRLRRERELEVDVPATDSAEDDARALIETCCGIPGALRMLLLDFPYAESLTAEFGLLWVVIEEVAPRLVLTDDERDELLRLVNDLPPARLAAAHQRAVPTPTDAARAPADVAGMIRRVESYNQRAGELPRVFVFTEHLAIDLAEEAAEELRRWQDRAAARLRLRHAALRELRHHLAEEEPDTRPPVLRVQFAPDRRIAPGSQSPDGYLLSAVLDHGPVPEPVVRLHQPVTLAAGLGHLAGVLEDRYAMLHPHLDRLVIEVVVPRALVTEPVDQWVLPALADDEPIGSRYTVVLRSYERISGRRYHRRWEHKSRLVRRQPVPGADVMHFVGPDESPNPRDLWDRLQPDGKLALVCGRPPARQAGLRPPDEYAAALEAGVPYLVWVRDAGLAGELRDWVEAALTVEPLRNLPDRVADHRSAEWLDRVRPDGLGTQMSIMACHAERDTARTSPILYAPGRTPS